jgi:hypothetical protein
MTYDLLLTETPSGDRLAEALSVVFGVPRAAVDVAGDDAADRNWDAPVLCTVTAAAGEIAVTLDVFAAGIDDALTTPDMAGRLAEALDTVVLYGAIEPIPSAHWLAAPGGLRTRARLYLADDEEYSYTIDAVAQAVPQLPNVRVLAQPEVIREHRLPTPLTQAFRDWGEALPGQEERDDALRMVCSRLGAWEMFVARASAGWPPDGWYPDEYYREDLETRDELRDLYRRLPAAVASRLETVLAELDAAFGALDSGGDQ